MQQLSRWVVWGLVLMLLIPLAPYLVAGLAGLVVFAILALGGLYLFVRYHLRKAAKQMEQMQSEQVFQSPTAPRYETNTGPVIHVEAEEIH
jgi:positive regulator of sigma E activity